jgi:hypothetical protein
MVDVLQFIFSHFSDGETAVYFSGDEPVSSARAVMPVLLPLHTIFSHRVECHYYLLAGVIPIAMEVL